MKTFLVRRKTIILVGVGLLLLVSGIKIGQYQNAWILLIKEETILNFKKFLKKESKNDQGKEDGLLAYAFTDPAEEKSFLYPPLKKLSDIRNANNKIFMQSKNFSIAYSSLKIISAEQINRKNGEQPVVEIKFIYQNREYSSFAYGKISSSQIKSQCASLILPGSGLNQSYKITKKDSKNYQYGIWEALQESGGNIFIFIKPNEDFLAWHNGSNKKLNGNFIWNWHMNRGGSYSVSYLVQVMAFMKWMKKTYEATILCGLSQGGTAVLLAGLQAEPTLAIVCSGYSIINREAEFSGPDQIVGIPSLFELYEPKIIKKELEHSSTKWFFSWGLEDQDIYKIEAHGRKTSEVLKTIENVTICIHKKNHIYPSNEIKEFIKNNLKF